MKTLRRQMAGALVLVGFALLPSTLVGNAAAEETQPVAPANAPPDSAKAIMSKLVGTWTTAGERDGKPFTGLYQARWNESETGLVYTTREGHEVSHGLGYWDPVTSEFVETWSAYHLNVVVRYRQFSGDHWFGTSKRVVDEKLQEEKVRVEFREGGYTFFVEAKGEETPFTVTNTRVSAEENEQAFRSFAELFQGGTWINTDKKPNAKHTFSWLPGKKVLKLNRRGGVYPGISLIGIDHRTQSVLFQEVDNDGMVGTAQMIQASPGEWKLFGHYTGENRIEDMLLTLNRVGPDEVKASGSISVNGKQEPWESQRWTRNRESSAAQSFDEAVPEKVRRHWRYLLGTWDYRYSQAGKEYSGVWTVKPAESTNALISHFEETSPNGKAVGNYLHGWDANAEQLVDGSVSVDGGVGISRYDLVSEKLAEGFGESTLPDGTKRTTKLRAEYSPDRIIWTNFETTKAGQKQDDIVFTFDRRRKKSDE
jgi:hypothetical protein